MNYKYLTETTLAKIDDDGLTRSSCSVENAAFKAWLLAGNTPLPADLPTAEALAAQAEASAYQVAIASAKADSVIQYLVSHTPAECSAYVATNVTNLATATALLQKFAMALCVLSKDKLK